MLIVLLLMIIIRAKDVWQKATSLLNHFRQVAALVAKLLMGGAFTTRILGRGGRSGSAMVPFEREMVVSCRLSIVTIAQRYLTIRLQFAVECLRRSNQQGWITLEQNLGRRGLTV